MSAEYLTRLVCDLQASPDCLRTFDAIAGVKETRRLARGIGWVHAHGQPDACPNCEMTR